MLLCILVTLVLGSCSSTTNIQIKSDIENKTGNTAGNIENYGWVVCNEDYMFFTNRYDGGKLYRYNFKTKILEKLLEDDVGFLNLSEDFLYYVDFGGGTEPNYIYDSICRVDLNGKNRKQLTKEGSWRQLMVKGDYALYTGVEPMSDLNLEVNIMRKDGSDQKKLLESNNVQIEWVGDKLYCIENQKTPYEININTLKKSEIKDVSFNTGDKFIFYKGYIYFTGPNGENVSEYGILKYNIKERKSDFLLQCRPSSFNVIDDILYFSSDKAVYACDVSKKEAKQVLNFSGDFILDADRYVAFYILEGKDLRGYFKDIPLGNGKPFILLMDKVSGDKILLTDKVYPVR